MIAISVDEDHTGHGITGVRNPVLASDVVNKEYADAISVTFNAVVFKGVIDCSSNPNYPAADRGWAYIVSVAGKIGGASGPDVLPRDLIICLDNSTPSGNQATVGSHWTLVQSTAVNDIVGPGIAVNNDFVMWDGVTGLIVKDGGLSFSTDGTFAANSDALVVSEKAIATFVAASIAAIPPITTGNLTDAGTDGITVTGGTNAVVGSGTSIAQHVADASHNGYLSSSDWTTFNSKQASLTLGNLTDAGTDGIVVTGGTGAVIGSGVSIAQHVADATHNGYLSSADWNTFNSGGGITPAALTKTDDTNITLTLGGTPATALLQATSLTLGWAGTLAVARGGTGTATAGAHTFFGNNTGSTAAPSFIQPAFSDLSGTLALSQTSMSTAKLLGRSTAGTGVAEEISIGTGLSLSSGVLSATVTSGRTVTTLSDSNTITPDSGYGANIEINTQSGGTLTINAPSGSPTNVQGLLLRIKTTNAKTFSWNAAFRASSLLPLPTSLSAGKTVYVGVVYNSADAVWDLTAVMKEY